MSVWSNADREKYKDKMGFSSADVAFRRSGRSTRQAFLIFAECYSSPDEWIAIVDHASSFAPQANRFLHDSMRGMAQALGFSQFEFTTGKRGPVVRLNLDSMGESK